MYRFDSIQLCVDKDPGLHKTYPLLTSSLVRPLIKIPTLSPASPKSSYFLKVSTPTIAVYFGLPYPTISILSLIDALP